MHPCIQVTIEAEMEAIKVEVLVFMQGFILRLSIQIFLNSGGASGGHLGPKYFLSLQFAPIDKISSVLKLAQI